MKNSNAPVEELIAKHFAGEATSAEEQLLSQWLSEGESNQTYYNALKRIYIESASLKILKHVDTDAAWNKLKAIIREDERINPGASPKVRALHTNTWWRVAAMLILIAGAGIALYIKMNTPGKPVLVSTGNYTQEVILPDSSSVFLNKNSSIQYAFTSNKREVTLTGEAFFEVIHNEGKPFVVHTGDLQIKDIGTAFNINSTPADSVVVVVESGEVQLTTSKNSRLNLTEGERSVYKRAANTFTRLSVSDPNALAYKTKIFVFENASLPAVIEKLNEVYGTHVRLGDNLKFCRLTSTFKNEKIDSILQIIAETLQLRIVKDNTQTSLEGVGCEE